MTLYAATSMTNLIFKIILITTIYPLPPVNFNAWASALIHYAMYPGWRCTIRLKSCNWQLAPTMHAQSTIIYTVTSLTTLCICKMYTVGVGKITARLHCHRTSDGTKWRCRQGITQHVQSNSWIITCCAGGRVVIYQRV